MTRRTVCGWTLTGWFRNQWRFTRSMELERMLTPAVGPISACVPGAVQADLVREGILDDPYVGTNSLAAEWTERRDWIYEAALPELDASSSRVWLRCEGLDHHGEIYVNGRLAGGFHGMSLPLRVDITALVARGRPNTLQIVFFAPPEIDGQYGYTSRVTEFKSRFNYVWDWCPRMVPTGIWRPVVLEEANGLLLCEVDVRSEIDGREGRVVFDVHVDADTDRDVELVALLTDDAGEPMTSCIETRRVAAGASTVEMRLAIGEPRRWHPWGGGEQTTYRWELSARAPGSKETTRVQGRVGFRSVDLAPVAGAPDDALPYRLRVNGCPIPLRGVNWVPLRPYYGTVGRDEYRIAILRFRALGVNLLRVWGGAILETEEFYSVCDEAGMLVWQEFPFSSSGIDNEPNHDESFLASLLPVAERYVRHARSHVSHVIWCGGNELMLAEYRPVSEEHPTIELLGRIVRALDPGKPFLPASPSGPRFTSRSDEYGRGVHHDVHGPWLFSGVRDHYAVFNADDALLRSEVGTPSTARPFALRARSGSHTVWPPTAASAYWRHRGSWWLQYDEIAALCGDFEEKDLDRYAGVSRYLQAEALRYAAGATSVRGEGSAGIVLWMGNEPFPNTANTALVEFDGSPKPAAYALARIWSSGGMHLRHAGLVVRPGDRALLVPAGATSDSIVLRAYDESGDLVWSGAGFDEAPLDTIVAAPRRYVLLRAEADASGGDDPAREEWLFFPEGPAGHPPFAALAAGPAASLELAFGGRDVAITNRGGGVVPFVTLTHDNVDAPLRFSDGFFSLLPGETRTVDIVADGGRTVRAESIVGGISIEAPIALEVTTHG